MIKTGVLQAQRHPSAWRLCRNWHLFVLYIGGILSCFHAARKCEEQHHTECMRQVMGHIYPGSFLLGLAWSWNKPELRVYECSGMIVFWLFYWSIDAVQQSGVNFGELKTLQHYMFTMFVGVCGAFRLARGPSRDMFVMVLLVIGFGFFVSMHPQPNAIGLAMHTLCGMWLACFLLAYIAKAEEEGTAFMIVAAITFISSQLGLTTVATRYMDPVAYFALVTVGCLLVDSVLPGLSD